MSSYNVEPCTFIYRVSSLAKVVDGDTIDVNIDLGFDVCTKQRVRLLGIDTPESRTSDKEEKGVWSHLEEEAQGMVSKGYCI